jgi:hypothetical protein
VAKTVTTPEARASRIINSSWEPLQEHALSTAGRRLLGARDVEGFLNTAPWADFITKLGQVTVPMTSTISAAAAGEYRLVGNGRVNVDMKAVDALSVKYAQSQGSKLIRSITETQRATVRAVMGQALDGQFTGDKAARLIRDTVGLHPAWAQAVVNQRERVLANALKEGKPLDKATAYADKQSERYAAKLLRRRADNIARTEILTSENLGRFATWADAIGNGYGRPDDVKEWDAELNECCESCRALHGEQVQWDHAFSNGKMMPPAHPGCRCAVHKMTKPVTAGEPGYDPELDDPEHLYAPGYESRLSAPSKPTDVEGIRVQVGGPSLATLTSDAHSMAMAAQTPTAAAGRDFSLAALTRHSEDELMDMVGQYGDDPDALDAIFAAIDHKAEMEIPAAFVPEPEPESVGWGTYHFDDSPATNPAKRPERKLSRDDQVAEEFDAYVSTSYARALDHTAGNFINRKMEDEAKRRGITSESLFTGPVSTAKKFASEELIAYWEQYGRQTFTSYRYHMFKAPSDAKAAEVVRRAGFQGTLGATSDRSTF